MSALVRRSSSSATFIGSSFSSFHFFRVSLNAPPPHRAMPFTDAASHETHWRGLFLPHWHPPGRHRAQPVFLVALCAHPAPVGAWVNVSTGGLGSTSGTGVAEGVVVPPAALPEPPLELPVS